MNGAKILGLHNLHQRLLDQLHHGEKGDNHTQPALAGGKQRDKGYELASRELFQHLGHTLARGQRLTLDMVALEHVGAPQFETFFRCCANMLARDGAMLVHTIGRMGSPGRTDAFTDKWIFPGGYIPALSETLAASEKVRLIASDVETLRVHYARTIREWYARCIANRASIEALMDARFYLLWTFYLAGAATAFEHGGMCNYQIQFIRDRNALPLTVFALMVPLRKHADSDARCRDATRSHASIG